MESTETNEGVAVAAVQRPGAHELPGPRGDGVMSLLLADFSRQGLLRQA